MKRILIFITWWMLALPVFADESPIDWVLAHPPVDASYACTEHWEGQFKSPGDALGTDCVVQRLVEEQGRLWSRAYKGDGTSNEDWYGWKVPLLSPCDCEIIRVHENPVQNQPGMLGEPPASLMIFRREDGVHFLYAHIREPLVEVGEQVETGQPVASIGNNGYARNPHLHAGAWKNGSPMQIRWDQRKMRMPPEFRDE